MSVLQSYEFNNGEIEFLVRVDYVKSASAYNKNSVKAKVIPSGVRVGGKLCEGIQKLSKEKLNEYGFYFEVPLNYGSKRRRRREVKRFIEGRLERTLGKLMQDRLIVFE